jgi:hypothetical protein
MDTSLLESGLSVNYELKEREGGGANMHLKHTLHLYYDISKIINNQLISFLNMSVPVIYTKLSVFKNNMHAILHLVLKS